MGADFSVTDTQIFGLFYKHANVCIICGAELPSDILFQEKYMKQVHHLEV